MSGSKKRVASPAHATNILETASYKKCDYEMNASTSSLCSCSSSEDNLVNIHNQETADTAQPEMKRRKILLVPNKSVAKNKGFTIHNVKEYLATVKRTLSTGGYKTFVKSLKAYKDNNDLYILCNTMRRVLETKSDVRYLVLGLQYYIRNEHTNEFVTYWSGLLQANFV